MKNRRQFLKMMAAAGAFGATGVRELFAEQRRAEAALKILILGGTGFIGPYQVRYAVERGHEVTVFNRGRREADLPESVIQLQGDRNNDLKALETGEWDVVIDNPSTLPVWVRDAASLLKDRAKHYIFISTISVYSDNSVPGADETAPLKVYEGADAMAETMESFQKNVGALYGPLKALSEKEAEKWFPGRTTIIRPGLIVGPNDPSDRFTYWPVRISRGGEVLAPGTPQDPTQVIDVRDLSHWTIRMAEQQAYGIYNATGPDRVLTMGEMLGSMVPLASRPVKLTFVPPDFLRDHNVRPWSDMPAWIPPIGETAGFSRVSIQRALDKGLTFRPIAETARDTLEWWRTLPGERQATLRAGIKPQREAEVLAAWHAKQGK